MSSPTTEILNRLQSAFALSDAPYAACLGSDLQAEGIELDPDAVYVYDAYDGVLVGQLADDGLLVCRSKALAEKFQEWQSAV